METSTKENVAQASNESLKLVTKFAMWAAAVGAAFYAISEVADKSKKLADQGRKLKASIEKCYDNERKPTNGKRQKTTKKAS